MTQDSFDKFMEMESTSNLFDLKEDGIFPVWDFIRVAIFGEEIQRNGGALTSQNLSVRKRFLRRIIQIKKAICLPKHVDIVYIYSPVTIDKGEQYYDRVAEDLIEYTKDEKCLYIGPVELYPNSRHKDHSMFFFNFLATMRVSFKKMSIENYKTISKAVKNFFGVDIPYEKMNGYYRQMLKSYYAYKCLLKWVRPRKIIVSMDLQKGLYFSAKMLGIPTCEIQHGTLIYQYPSYSYPSMINNSSNIAYADIFAMPGDGWGVTNNIPSKKRVVLGNSQFVIKSQNICDNGSVVFISNLIHKKFLLPLAI